VTGGCGLDADLCGVQSCVSTLSDLGGVMHHAAGFSRARRERMPVAGVYLSVGLPRRRTRGPLLPVALKAGLHRRGRDREVGPGQRRSGEGFQGTCRGRRCGALGHGGDASLAEIARRADKLLFLNSARYSTARFAAWRAWPPAPGECRAIGSAAPGSPPAFRSVPQSPRMQPRNSPGRPACARCGLHHRRGVTSAADGR